MKKYLTLVLSIIFISLCVFVYQKNKITISVIIPAYNAEKYIAKCLDSILVQDGDIELIIINDGSTDKTPNIINEYAQKHSNIKVINQENQGVSSARNRGLKVASSKYITFVDSDDWLEPNAIKNAKNILKKDKSDVLITNYFDVYDTEWVRNTRGEEATRLVQSINKYPSRSLDKIALFTPFYSNDSISDLYYVSGGLKGRFFKREFILKNKIDFPNNTNCYEGDIFITKVFLYNSLISVDTKPYYNYLNRTDSISKSPSILQCGRKSRDIILNSSEYQKTSHKKQMIIDDLFVSYILLGLTNYIRHSLPTEDITKEAEEIYYTFGKYNAVERKSLRNFLKLRKFLNIDKPIQFL